MPGYALTCIINAYIDSEYYTSQALSIHLLIRLW